VYGKKLYNNEFGNFIFVSSSEKIKSYTGDKKFFLGSGGLENPDGLKKVNLNNDNSIGKSSCIAIELELEIESFSSKKVSIILGTQNNIIDAKDLAYKYSKINNCNLELENVKKYWEDLLRKNKD
jgi:cyclic beta-1,2-glucan synthetase